MPLPSSLKLLIAQTTSKKSKLRRLLTKSQKLLLGLLLTEVATNLDFAPDDLACLCI